MRRYSKVNEEAYIVFKTKPNLPESGDDLGLPNRSIAGVKDQGL